MHFPGVDLVVVNYRTPDELDGFLRSYEESQLEVPHSLHVVNVTPTVLDQDVVRNHGSLVPFSYTEHEDNVGYAGACNDASTWSDRRVMAFFNADTRLRPGVVEACHEWLMSDDELAVVGPKQVNDEGKITHAGIFGTSDKPRLRGWLRLDRGDYSEDRTDAVSVSGSAYFVKRAVWDEMYSCSEYIDCPGVAERKPLGALLPTAHFYEETYYSYHVRSHGYKVGYMGSQTMIHRWHKSLPVGQASKQHWAGSQRLFREACDHHGIEHD